MAIQTTLCGSLDDSYGCGSGEKHNWSFELVNITTQTCIKGINRWEENDNIKYSILANITNTDGRTNATILGVFLSMGVDKGVECIGNRAQVNYNLFYYVRTCFFPFLLCFFL